MNTAALLADAMTEYVLTVGVNRAAPAVGPPEDMAAWLEAHGYQVVHHSPVRHRSRHRHAGSRPPDHGRGRVTVRMPEGGAR
jgi:hypothetical protein